MLKELKQKLTKEEQGAWEEAKKNNYKKSVVFFDCDDGNIAFSEKSWMETESKIPLSYDDYLDLQYLTIRNCRHGFERCYYDSYYSEFKGQIEKISNDNVCFKRIYISGTNYDYFFEGKEDHVWMSQAGFESFAEGDCVRFVAETYRYLKTRNGKALDFGLRNPSEIEKIGLYELPSDDELLEQSIEELICETCFLADACDGVCIVKRSEKNKIQKEFFKLLKNDNKAE